MFEFVTCNRRKRFLLILRKPHMVNINFIRSLFVLCYIVIVRIELICFFCKYLAFLLYEDFPHMLMPMLVLIAVFTAAFVK